MALSNTKTFGFCDQVIQLMQGSKDALKTEGLDVTNWITELGTMKGDAVADALKQDDMEAALKTQTKKAQTSSKNVYDKSSTRLDAMIGVFGKNTDLGKQAARLRSSIIKQSKKKTVGDGGK
jgi:hypothetical protein